MASFTIREFEKKYELYSKELMNISFGYTKSKDDSFDIVQNVFYKLFNLKKDFINLEDEKYFLIRLTINESLDFIKKNKRIVNVDEKTIDLIADEKNDKRLEKLAILVKSLPEKYRRVIILYYYDNLKIEDIVNVIKISKDAVKKRLERARLILKEKMEE